MQRPTQGGILTTLVAKTRARGGGGCTSFPSINVSYLQVDISSMSPTHAHDAAIHVQKIGHP